MRVVIALAVAAFPLIAAAATPAQTCQSNKNKAAGKYDYCRQKAEARFALTGDDAQLTASLQKCLDQYNAKWPLLESKATAAGGACPSTGDQAAIQGVTDAHTANVAAELAGGALQKPQHFPATGQTTCSDTSGAAISCAGTGQDGETQAGTPLAYTDNGDGTITDQNTGLVWEKLSMDGSVHDVGNVYSWSGAFVSHVEILNSAHFAGHNDWRLPNIRELESIVDYGSQQSVPISPIFSTPCDPGCTVLTCSCVVGAFYWSSTSFQSPPAFAWGLNFGYGNTTNCAPLTTPFQTGACTTKPYGVGLVRAVRGGS
jgi:hypothetical protein